MTGKENHCRALFRSIYEYINIMCMLITDIKSTGISTKFAEAATNRPILTAFCLSLTKDRLFNLVI